MTVPTTTNRSRTGRTVLVWLAGNLLIGLFLILPLGWLDTLSYYIRATHGAPVVVPYGSDGAKFAVAQIAIAVIVLGLVAVLFNRRQWRRIRVVRQFKPSAVLVITVATIVLEALPYLWFYFGTDRSL